MYLMRKWLMTVVAMALATTTVVCWQLWREERARADALQAAHDAPRESNSKGAVAASPSNHSLPAADIAVSGGSGGWGAETDDGQGYASDEYRLLQDDGYREAYRKHRVLELSSGHIEITRVLGISQASADRLLALQVDRELEYLSVPHRNPHTEKELQARKLENERNQRDEDAQIGAIIGDTNVARWHAYQDSLPLRHEVRAVGRDPALGGSPLRDEQVDALVGVMYAERQRVRHELEQFSAGLTSSGGMKSKMRGYQDARAAELDRTAEERIRAAASRILSPEQLAVFVEKRRSWQEMNDAEVAMYRAADEARRRMGATP